MLKTLAAMWEWRSRRTGMITSTIASAGAFFKSHPDVPIPDLQLVFVLALVDDHARKLHIRHGISCHVDVLRPFSRGTVELIAPTRVWRRALTRAFSQTSATPNCSSRAGNLQQLIMESSPLSAVRARCCIPCV